MSFACPYNQMYKLFKIYDIQTSVAAWNGYNRP